MLNKDEELKFKRLKEMCAELHVLPPPDVFIRFEVHDKNGKLLHNHLERGHSWVRNYYNSFIDMFLCSAGVKGTGGFAAGYISIKDIAGNYYAAGAASYGPLNHKSSGAGATNGICVGTGNTAWSAANVALATLIAHGNSASQLSYAANSAVTASYTAGTKSWTLTMSRVFNNNSGSSITVKETGLSSFNGTQILLERSVLGVPVEVANGAQLTVTYTITVDLSAID
jgi:hypothetical protein